MKNKIDKNTKFSELTEKYPETIEVLLESGMHCFGCAMAAFETIEQGAMAHGMDEKETEKLITEINKKIASANKKADKKR